MTVGFTSANDYISKLNKLGHTLFMCIASFTTASATRYFSPSGSSTTENDAVFIAPFAGTISLMRAQCASAPGGGQTFTFTVRKNFADTSMVATITGAASFDTGAITSNPVTVAAGDVVALKFVGTSGATSSAFRAIIVIQPSS